MTSTGEHPTPEIPEIEPADQAELRTVVEGLKSNRERLRALQEKLPVSPSRGEDDMDSMDVVTELRSVIDCVLADSIDPAIRDLLAAVAYAQKGRGPGDR